MASGKSLCVGCAVLVCIFAPVWAQARGECICPLFFDPVCDLSTGIEYSNSCFASCDDIDPENLFEGPCPKCGILGKPCCDLQNEACPGFPGLVCDETTTTCVKDVPPCEQEPGVVGDCKAAIPAWTFDPRSGKCKKFSYGGCGGNDNRFDSEKECILECVLEDDCCPPGHRCCDSTCIPSSPSAYECFPSKCC